MKRHLVAGLLVAIVGAAAGLTSRALATTIIVTNTNNSGAGSLRDAIALASPGDEIQFHGDLSGAPIVLTSGELFVDKHLTITGLGRDLTILDGNAASRVLRVGEAATVVVSDLTIRNGLEQGAEEVAAEGGGIYNAGVLTLAKVTVQRNACQYPARSGKGGGIFNKGTLQMDYCSIVGNGADTYPHSFGGGLYNEGRAFIRHSSISDNQGGELMRGAAAYNTAGGLMIIEDSSIVKTFGGGDGIAIENIGGNLSLIRCTVAYHISWRGGAISGADLVQDSLVHTNYTGVGGGTIVRARVIDGSTIAGNGADHDFIVDAIEIKNSTIVGNNSWMGGGIFGRVSNSTIVGNYSEADGCRMVGDIMIKNSLVVGNGGGDYYGEFKYCDCTDQTISLGHNIIGADQNCPKLQGGSIGDLLGVDWRSILENSQSWPEYVLSDNGGNTPTIALLPNSPAIDAIPDDACTDLDDQPVAADQRGVPRPQGAGCDVGAFEFSQPRDTLFWLQQCRQHSSEYSSDQLGQFFAAIEEKSSAFPECAVTSCDALEPNSPRSSWKDKAARELLAVELNLASGRLTNGRPTNLPGLTNATTVGAAVADAEAIICNANATRQDLAHAKDIAEALSRSGD